MDSTIIVLNTNNKLNLQKLADYITQKNIVADVIVASTTKHESVEGINEKVFAENNDDKILNTLIKDVKTEKLVVVRKVENDNFEDIEKFLNGLTENNSICVYKKRNNKNSCCMQGFYIHRYCASRFCFT